MEVAYPIAIRSGRDRKTGRDNRAAQMNWARRGGTGRDQARWFKSVCTSLLRRPRAAGTAVECARCGQWWGQHQFVNEECDKPAVSYATYARLASLYKSRIRRADRSYAPATAYPRRTGCSVSTKYVTFRRACSGPRLRSCGEDGVHGADAEVETHGLPCAVCTYSHLQ